MSYFKFKDTNRMFWKVLDWDNQGKMRDEGGTNRGSVGPSSEKQEPSPLLSSVTLPGCNVRPLTGEPEVVGV